MALSVFVCVHVYMYMCMFACMHACVRVCVCVCVCVCVHKLVICIQYIYHPHTYFSSPAHNYNKWLH